MTQPTARFLVQIEFDEESSNWVTFVPALNGISTFGRTREEALVMTVELIEGYLETLAETGQALPKVEVEEVEVAVA